MYLEYGEMYARTLVDILVARKSVVQVPQGVR